MGFACVITHLAQVARVEEQGFCQEGDHHSAAIRTNQQLLVDIGDAEIHHGPQEIRLEHCKLHRQIPVSGTDTINTAKYNS